MVGPAQRRQLAQWIVKAKAFSQQRTCRLAGLSRRMWAYQSKRQLDTEVEQVIQTTLRRHPGWGFWKIYHRLRRQGHPDNHKRLWRIYRHLGLNLPRRKRKRLPDRVRQALGVEIDYSLPAKRVIHFLEQLIESHGKPACLRCDNGPCDGRPILLVLP